MPFRFLHAADIHLDSPLRGLSGHDGRVAERIRGAPREAFRRLVGTAIEERVDLLVIAGDLYDGDWRDCHTGLFFASQMGRLNEAGIPVCVLHGNHDAASRLTRSLSLPGNVRVFPARKPETFRFDELGVALHGQSFAEAAETGNLVPGYPDPVEDAFNIGVLHTALDGRGGHENYAPCELPQLVAKGYDYWALGHVHRAEIVRDERPHVVFPGNLQGRHIRETGAKGAVLVSVEDREVVDLRWRHEDVVRWAAVAADVGAAATVEDVVDGMRGAVEAAVAERADGRLLACRIELRGRSEIHGEILAAERELVEEARSAALGLGDGVAWIEKVVVATEPAATAPDDDAVGELGRLLGDAEDDPDLVRRLDEDIGRLAGRLPAEIRAAAEDGAFRAAVEGDHAALIRELTPYLRARLAGRGA